MDYIVDLYRMKVITALNSSKKVHWSQFVILAILSNHRKLQDLAVEQFNKLLLSENAISRLITHEKSFKGIVRLPYKNPKSPYGNSILTKILAEVKFEFNEITAFSSEDKHVNQEKSICLDKEKDIHFKLQFAKCITDKEKDAVAYTNKQNNVLDMANACGIVYSNTRSSEFIFNFLRNKYGEDTVVPNVQLKSLRVCKVTKLAKNMTGTWDDQQISKNLNNVFLEEDVKTRITDQIARFSKDQWYIDRGIPRTLGILLHGVPGCGKTSLIKAIAGHFNRKIIIINFKLVKSWRQLEAIFSQRIYHEEKDYGTLVLPHTTVVYVLEDFDCMSETILDRMSCDKKKTNSSTMERRKKIMERTKPKKGTAQIAQLEMMLKSLKNPKNKKKDDAGDISSSDDDEIPVAVKEYSSDDEQDIDTLPENKVSMSDLLEKLDGIVEMHGRILFMTTNMRHKIDSALIRPGRIDLDIELKPPSTNVAKSIFTHMYKDHDSKVLNKLWDQYLPLMDKIGKLSTAEVMNSCMYLNPETGIQNFCSKLPDSKTPLKETVNAAE